jgi:hypothetical protein
MFWTSFVIRHSGIRHSRQPPLSVVALDLMMIDPLRNGGLIDAQSGGSPAQTQALSG